MTVPVSKLRDKGRHGGEALVLKERQRGKRVQCILQARDAYRGEVRYVPVVHREETLQV
jgi:hypothetical protein